MPPSEFTNHTIVTFGSREVALQAFGGLSGKPFYGFKVLVQVARERAEPYLAVVTFKRLSPEEEISMSEEEGYETEEQPRKRKRIEIDMTKPGWNKWKAAKISGDGGDKDAESKPSKRKRRRPTTIFEGVGRPLVPAAESLEYQIGNLDRQTTVGQLMLFLDSHDM